MKNKDPKKLIVDTLTEKSATKQTVYDNTLESFNLFKEVLQEMVKEYNEQLKNLDKRVQLEFWDKGAFECELKFAGDLLVFNMHSNIFEFDKGHGVWKISYVSENNMNSYTGIIHIYNFLNDSFKYNRLDDLGYLIARVFINKENHYFVEGKRQLGYLYNNFAKSVIDKQKIKSIVESAILYCLDFDLLVPPYDTVKIVTVAEMSDKINNSKIQTGKRLGFKFYADDDQA
jgi:hypothetical protein